MALIQALSAAAKGLGAVSLGVAPAAGAAHAGAFRAWIAEGAQGSMRYLTDTAETRLDPRHHAPWARSAVLCAFPYDPDRGAEGTLLPAIARYARGEDYHRVLPGILRQLAAHLDALAGVPVRTLVFADTSPLMERDLAARAGLGWIGKHAGLLTGDAGSWLLLGGFLTDLDLVPSEPQPDRCGTCTACMTACPTGAIPAPYRVDARRCIAYLTIEHRGWIPRDLRPYLADWLFGCDLCQEACPWNAHAPAGLTALRARPEYAALALADLVALPGPRYTALFRHSALKRATRAGLRRNAMILAGNRRDETCRSALEEALGDPDPVLRGTSAWALGRLGGSIRMIRDALSRETDPESRLEMAEACRIR